LAEQCYRQAVASNPKQAGYHLQLASVLAGQDQVTEAVQQAEEARRLEPNNKDVLEAQAKLNVVQNDVARSLRNWLRAYRPLP
jgi:cytochrome c-type biogenesis protein CcmH/NrfG